MQDLVTIVLAVKGDKNAFSELMHSREKKLYKIAFMYVKNEQGALDIVSEAVYRAYLNIKKLKTPEFFDTWLVKIVINSSMDYLRKNRITVPIEDAEVCAHLSDGPSVELYSLIDCLDSKLKTVIILKYFEEYTIPEISKIMNCPESSVKNYLHKALVKLRLELKEGLEYEGV